MLFTSASLTHRDEVLLRVVCALLAALVTSTFSANAAADDELHRSPHTEESDVLVGAKGLAIVELREDEAVVGGGGSVHVEFSLVPSWLELELGVAATHAGAETTITFEPLLKKNFRLAPALDLYLGIGPVLGASMGETAVFVVGGLLTVGCYVWLADWIGIDFDLGGQLAAVDGAPVVEIALGIGAVLRI